MAAALGRILPLLGLITYQLSIIGAYSMYDEQSNTDNSFRPHQGLPQKNKVEKLRQKVVSLMTDDEVQMVLDVHNDLRRLPKASNMHLVVSGWICIWK